MRKTYMVRIDGELRNMIKNIQKNNKKYVNFPKASYLLANRMRKYLK